MTGVAAVLIATAQLVPFAQPSPPSSFEAFGIVEPTDVEQVAGGLYDRRAVRVKGTLLTLEKGPQERYFELRDSRSVVLIPLQELLHDMPSLIGKRVEVVGFVRRLKEKQELVRCPAPRPESYCQDPNLPPTPDLQGTKSNWPRVSITIWTITDATPMVFKKGESPRLADTIATLDAKPRDVKVSGRFCGVGLCGPPPGPPPAAGAWLLQDGEDVVWVLGKEPRGKGWKLDPGYPGDSRRWLEVEGRLEKCGGALCLRAKRVAMSAPPQDEPEESAR